MSDNNEAKAVPASSVIAVRNLRHNLLALKDCLGLVQAADTVSLEGITRASASQIVERASRDFGVSNTPSEAGQVFSSLGLRTTVTHGKSRFVLDHTELEALRKRIIARLEETATTLSVSLDEFKDTCSRVQALEDRVKEIVKQKSQERELTTFIAESRNEISRIHHLEDEVESLKEQAAVAKELEKECQELAKKVKAMPSLEQRKAKLQSSIAQYQAEERALAASEAHLASSITALKSRKGLVELATLQQAIEESKQELGKLSEQLGEKRSLLDRLLHRNEVKEC